MMVKRQFVPYGEIGLRKIFNFYQLPRPLSQIRFSSVLAFRFFFFSVWFVLFFNLRNRFCVLLFFFSSFALVCSFIYSFGRNILSVSVHNG